MNIFKIETACILDSLKEHKDIKKKLLSLINNTKSDFLNTNDQYSNDLIHRLDWNESRDFTREWVKFLKPYLQKHFDECAIKLGYQKANITNIWFQQYNQNGKHGWHIHSENYTGVYYLKFSSKDAKTELINPFNHNPKMVINAKEGDIAIFPSYVIHRATKQIDDLKKIIVSFNFNFENINTNLFRKIDNLSAINI